MAALRAVSRAAEWRKALAATYPWTTTPLIVGAPMRVMSGPHLAVAVSSAGGLGFIGPGEKPESTSIDLAAAKELLRQEDSKSAASKARNGLMPVGVGFQTWNGDLGAAAEAVGAYRPSAAWLFAPRNGQEELDEWTGKIREASPGTQIWIQVGTLREALAAAESSSRARPDVLVLQGAEAGGHGRATDGIGIITLLPEVADAIEGSDMVLVAAGGIIDGRGVAAALSLGAGAAAMGTRFLAATEARIRRGYQAEVVRAGDGGASTTRTHLYNRLRGTTGWPAQWSPRGLTNASWAEHRAGVPFEELKRRHDNALEDVGKGDEGEGWGPRGRLATYVGAGVGLLRGVEDAGEIVRGVRREAGEIVRGMGM